MATIKTLFFALLFGSSISFADDILNPVTEHRLPKNLQAIEARLSPGDLSQYDFQFTVDFVDKNIRALFIENLNDASNVIRKQCSYIAPLKVNDEAAIKKLLSSVTYCKQQGHDDIEVDYAYLDLFNAYTRKPTSIYDEGEGVELEKYFVGAPGMNAYFCGNGQQLYSYLKKLATKNNPRNCPQSYKKLFEFEE